MLYVEHLPKMLQLCLVLVLFSLILNVHFSAGVADPEALRECGDLHRIDIHTIANAHAEYSNSKCMLTCYEGNKTLSVNAISEGYVCDQASQSKCRNGHCSGLEAVHQCSTLHHLDLSNFKTVGTEYSADLCTLICVIEGKVASINSVNEGAFCNLVPNGICHKGNCVSDGIQNSTVKTTIPTTSPTTNVTTVQTTIMKTEPPFDEKTDLIKKGQEFLVQVDYVIKTHSGNVKVANQVTELIAEKTRIKNLIEALESATDNPTIKMIEHGLLNTEKRVTQELASIDYILKHQTTV